MTAGVGAYMISIYLCAGLFPKKYYMTGNRTQFGSASAIKSRPAVSGCPTPRRSPRRWRRRRRRPNFVSDDGAKVIENNVCLPFDSVGFT